MRIRVGNEELSAADEYVDPDEDNSDSREMTRYIEMNAGQRFEVDVTLEPGFTFRHAPYVHITVQIDQSIGRVWVVGYKETSAIGGQVQVPSKITCSSVGIMDEKTGAWFEHTFEFGALGVSKSCPLRMPSTLAQSTQMTIHICRRISLLLASKHWVPFEWKSFERYLRRAANLSSTSASILLS